MASIEQDIKQSHFVNQQLKANINIIYTAHWLTTKITAVLKPYLLTHEQFNVLRILKGKHPECMCQKDILHRMVAPSSNLTLLVKKLVTKKMIAVKVSTVDKREYMINITRTGLNTLDKLEKVLNPEQMRYSELTEKEASQLSNLLDKLRS